MMNLFGHRHKIAILFAIYTLAEIVLVLVYPGNTVVSDWLMVMAPVVAILVFGLMMKKLPGEHRLFWFLLMLGIFGELLAQSIWVYYDKVLHSPTPDLSEADIFWILQSIAFIAALIVRSKQTIYGLRYSLDMAIILVGTFSISWKYLIQPIVASSGDLATIIVDLIYPLSDITILLLNFLLIYNRRTTFVTSVNRFLTLGFLVYVVGDTIYLLLGDLAGYEVDNLLNPFWLAATFLLTLACIYSDQPASAEAVSEGETGHISKGKMWLPYTVLGSLVVLLLFEAGLNDSIVSGIVVSVLLISLRQITVMVENSRLLNELKHALEKSEYLASHDGLTCLLNRRTFEEKLAAYMQGFHRPGQRMALMFFDLDGFKQVNDTHGHDVGDALLRTIAARMQRLQREDMLQARLGGDEFVVLLPCSGADQEVHHYAQTMITAITEPVTMNGICLLPRTSIGIAIYPDHAQTPDNLMKLSDIAMYRSKEKGSNLYTIYE
ncbi:GGDEF domain-containing protein [Paenibacillus sp. YPG26]|uniref:GGDEF domain-containing protein n=1 Tax=Paenibacillus sp. YPG26 TaxID=2878915 RepID=UPI00203FB4DD|nr:GGDEF domain-containing protein [Paenibacillus sp. YPG26]USB32976.1 GGDEF domain-containing protein [Paenibacillus sp. YPG26]